MTTRTATSSSLRTMSGERGAVLVPSVVDALAARVVDDLGFRALCLACGRVLDRALGRPGLPVADLVDLADRLARIREVTSRPVMIDDGAMATAASRIDRVMRRLAAVGANGFLLRDDPAAAIAGPRLPAPAAEAAMVERIKTIVDGRLDAGLVLIARTELSAPGGFGAAVERGARYHAAGADVIAVGGLRRATDVAELSRQLRAPLMVDLDAGGLDRTALAGVGCAFVLCPDTALRAAMVGMRSALSHLHSSGRGGG